MQTPSILAVVGPTGSGKTDLGIALARRFGAEIINADSRQVYRRLDIGSAKPTAAQQAAAPHHLIDVVDPDRRFDCAQFQVLAEAAVADITRRGKRVVVVGGTGLYVEVLRGGLFEGPPRDPALRAQLQAEEAAVPGTLHRRLAAVDPQRAARVHPNDHVRLVRALEVYLLSGRSISEGHRRHSAGEPRCRMHVVALDLARAILYERINARCGAMLAAGLADELRHLYAAGYDPQLPSLQSLGYREIGAHVRGECDLDTALQSMAQATRNFAKRQLTWFRGHPPVVWVPPCLSALEREALRAWPEAA